MNMNCEHRFPKVSTKKGMMPDEPRMMLDEQRCFAPILAKKRVGPRAAVVFARNRDNDQVYGSILPIGANRFAPILSKKAREKDRASRIMHVPRGVCCRPSRSGMATVRGTHR